MNINIQPEVRNFLKKERQSVVMIRSSGKMMSQNNREDFREPEVRFKLPESGEEKKFNRYLIDDILFFCDKSLSSARDITLEKVSVHSQDIFSVHTKIES